jgi:uncharacterized protein
MFDPADPLPPQAFALALAGAACIGMAKSGLGGLALLNILIMSQIFGARAAVGIILPLLLAADLFVFPIFRRYAAWRDVMPMLGIALVGVILGTVLLHQINEPAARRTIGAIIFSLLALHFLARRLRHLHATHLSHHPAFTISCGLFAGLSTTLANAAGPVMTVYLVVRGVTKEFFLGYSARFFLLTNLLKIPFLTAIGLITPQTLLLNLKLLPAVALGIAIGYPIVRALPQPLFNVLMIASALLAGLVLLLR